MGTTEGPESVNHVPDHAVLDAIASRPGTRTDALPHVFLDISRLIGDAGRSAPSGIDRVEMAYARRWAALPEEAGTFVGQILSGPYAALPRVPVLRFLATLAAAWESGRPGPEMRAARRLGRGLRIRSASGLGQLALARRLRRTPHPKAFLLVSHRALDRAGPIESMRRAGCAFVPLIHDLIPLEHPEFARPGHAERHHRRIANTAALADAIIVNSRHTARALAPHVTRRALPPRVTVAPLGIDAPAALSPALPLEPYFVVLGTIEPRKNHLLLLHLWRDLSTRLGSAAPRLVVIGRRGWENENIVDLLDRSDVLRATVKELGAVPDREAWSVLRGARALLFPSFAEGYGLPLGEALTLGVPVICSDLPALREVGADVPEYLDPLDGVAWRNIVLDYAAPESRARAAQLHRIRDWRQPLWETHFDAVDAALTALTPHGAALGREVVPATRSRAPAAWLLGGTAR